MLYYSMFDIYYVVLVIPAILFALFAQMKVQSAYRKYGAVRTNRGLTGAQAAETILRDHGLNDIRVEHVSGHLSDHYDPRARVIRLSDATYQSASVAAVGIAAHEAGHAVQHAEAYGPIKLRQSIIPLTRFGSFLAFPLILMGLLFNYGYLINIGIAFFGVSVVFQLVTLPVEFDASRRAIRALEGQHALTETELPQARKMLSAAAMTYVAALAVSLAQLLRLLLLFGGRNDRR